MADEEKIIQIIVCEDLGQLWSIGEPTFSSPER